MCRVGCTEDQDVSKHPGVDPTAAPSSIIVTEVLRQPTAGAKGAPARPSGESLSATSSPMWVESEQMWKPLSASPALRARSAKTVSIRYTRVDGGLQKKAARKTPARAKKRTKTPSRSGLCATKAKPKPRQTQQKQSPQQAEDPYPREKTTNVSAETAKRNPDEPAHFGRFGTRVPDQGLQPKVRLLWIPLSSP